MHVVVAVYLSTTAFSSPTTSRRSISIARHVHRSKCARAYSSDLPRARDDVSIVIGRITVGVCFCCYYYFRIVLRAGVVKKLCGERPRGRDREHGRQAGRGAGGETETIPKRVQRKFSPALSVSRPRATGAQRTPVLRVGQPAGIPYGTQNNHVENTIPNRVIHVFFAHFVEYTGEKKRSCLT